MLAYAKTKVVIMNQTSLLKSTKLATPFFLLYYIIHIGILVYYVSNQKKMFENMRLLWQSMAILRAIYMYICMIYKVSKLCTHSPVYILVHVLFFYKDFSRLILCCTWLYQLNVSKTIYVPIQQKKCHRFVFLSFIFSYFHRYLTTYICGIHLDPRYTRRNTYKFNARNTLLYARII